MNENDQKMLKPGDIVKVSFYSQHEADHYGIILEIDSIDAASVLWVVRPTGTLDKTIQRWHVTNLVPYEE